MIRMHEGEEDLDRAVVDRGVLLCAAQFGEPVGESVERTDVLADAGLQIVVDVTGRTFRIGCRDERDEGVRIVENTPPNPMAMFGEENFAVPPIGLRRCVVPRVASCTSESRADRSRAGRVRFPDRIPSGGGVIRSSMPECRASPLHISTPRNRGGGVLPPRSGSAGEDDL